MRYYLDTEFDENGRTIDLISIALVAEDGREFYAVSNEFDAEKCNQWVKDNVLTKLPPNYGGPGSWWMARAQIAASIRAFVRPHTSPIRGEDWRSFPPEATCLQCESVIHPGVMYGLTVPGDRDGAWRTVEREANGLLKPGSILDGECPKAPKPEVWAYFADYDWVVLCQLYGRMLDLPPGWPMWCRDLKQEMDRLGINKDYLNTAGIIQAPEDEHGALSDARWNKRVHDYLLSRPDGTRKRA